MMVRLSTTTEFTLDEPKRGDSWTKIKAWNRRWNKILSIFFGVLCFTLLFVIVMVNILRPMSEVVSNDPTEPPGADYFDTTIDQGTIESTSEGSVPTTTDAESSAVETTPDASRVSNGFESFGGSPLNSCNTFECEPFDCGSDFSCSIICQNGEQSHVKLSRFINILSEVRVKNLLNYHETSNSSIL